MAGPGQVIRLVNEGDTPFDDMYGNQRFVIPPQGQMFVDYDAVCLWLGHPEANDFDPRNRVRVAEYHRLRGRYGIDAKELEQSLNGIQVDADELFQSMRPKLAAYDAADGTRVITVADDPSGDSLVPIPPDTGDNQGLILARMQQMEQEMANLRTQLANQARAEQALNDAQPLTDDESSLPRATSPADIPGTIISPEPELQSAPRPSPRTSPGEDAPTRVRVTG